MSVYFFYYFLAILDFSRYDLNLLISVLLDWYGNSCRKLFKLNKKGVQSS